MARTKLHSAILLFVTICKICCKEFDYRSKIDQCWDCEYKINNEIDKYIKISKCNKKAGPFCANKCCYYCYNRSYASHHTCQYLISEITKDGTEINADPRHLAKHSRKSCNYKCYKCQHIFPSRISSITDGSWCSYCASHRLCEEDDCKYCFEKSFASHPKAKYWSSENKKSARQVFKCSENKYFFDCNKCNHSFDISLGNVTNGQWCKYCGKRELCNDKNCDFCHKRSFASHPKAKYWSDKNNKTSREVFKHTKKKYFFNCDKCKKSFNSSLNDICKGTWCRFCKNKTEKLFKIWFEDTFPDLILTYQPTYKWCVNKKTKIKLPFDFSIEELKLIIELDGNQHFKQVKNWTSSDFTKNRDIFKMETALNNGYTIIRICQEDIWYKKLKLNNIKSYIKNYEVPIIVYLSTNKSLYNCHKILKLVSEFVNGKLINIISKYL
jgi:hypothetical protein